MTKIYLLSSVSSKLGEVVPIPRIVALDPIVVFELRPEIFIIFVIVVNYVFVFLVDIPLS